MSLEQSLRRLVLQPSVVCRQCRRAFASTTRTGEQQNATSAFAELLQSSRNENASHQRSRASPPRRASEAPSAATTSSPGSPAASAQSPRTAYDIAQQAIRESSAARRKQQQDEALADLQRPYNRKDLELQMTRRWKIGDVYAPHDLSGVEMAKWKRVRRKPKSKYDVMDQLGMNPLDHYKNFSIMSEYVTEMGRIRHSNDTSLRPVNQRRMAKAIRRAIGLGLMPSVYRHPEILREELQARGRL